MTLGGAGASFGGGGGKNGIPPFGSTSGINDLNVSRRASVPKSYPNTPSAKIGDFLPHPDRINEIPSTPFARAVVGRGDTVGPCGPCRARSPEVAGGHRCGLHGSGTLRCPRRARNEARLGRTNLWNLGTETLVLTGCPPEPRRASVILLRDDSARACGGWLSRVTRLDSVAGQSFIGHRRSPCVYLRY